MKAKDVCIMMLFSALLVLVVGYAATGWLTCVSGNPAVGLADNPRATEVRVMGEFKLHGQDCVAVGVFPSGRYDSNPMATFVDCNHGLVPANPLLPDGGTTTMHDTWLGWD